MRRGSSIADAVADAVLCPRGALVVLVLWLSAILLLSGCASQPIVLVVDKGTIVVDGVATMTGEGVRYSRGVLVPGEAAATWSGDVSVGANPSAVK